MYTNAPTLLSENLILRGPEARDQEPVIAFLQDEDRAAGFGALPNRGDAWRWFALNVGHWAMHGYGYFIIETKAGETAGMSGIWNPEEIQKKDALREHLGIKESNRLKSLPLNSILKKFTC